jgi:hypothetical protein
MASEAFPITPRSLCIRVVHNSIVVEPGGLKQGDKSTGTEKSKLYEGLTQTAT